MACIFNCIYFTIYADTGYLLLTRTLDENRDGQQRTRTGTADEYGDSGGARGRRTSMGTADEYGDGGRKKRTVPVMREVGRCVC